MRKYYFFTLSVLILISVLIACSDDNNDDYIPASPVVVDLTKVPYPKLSDYKFFDGDIKNLSPSLDVLPYEPSSSLFSDYAHKKRFVWMPKGTKATFDSNGTILNLPVGAAIIKNFYYDNVQPGNTTRIIETRIMIRKSSGWIFAEYIWNEEQTEAFLDTTENGAYLDISWKDENNIIKNVNYRMPSQVQCIICHKKKEIVNGSEVTSYIPIGIKPQNLNKNYTFGTETKNQLTKWMEYGYLENITLPSAAESTVDYNDTSKSLNLRVRSYIDINCAHCHTDERHCDYRPMRFAFSDSGNLNGQTNLGICVDTEDMQDFEPYLNKIVSPGDAERSMLFYRINTTDETFRMPLHGRSLIHEEGVALIQQWINSLQNCP